MSGGRCQRLSGGRQLRPPYCIPGSTRAAKRATPRRLLCSSWQSAYGCQANSADAHDSCRTMMQSSADALHSVDAKVQYVSPTTVLLTYSDQESSSLLHDHFHKSLHKLNDQPGTCARKKVPRSFFTRPKKPPKSVPLPASTGPITHQKMCREPPPAYRPYLAPGPSSWTNPYAQSFVSPRPNDLAVWAHKAPPSSAVTAHYQPPYPGFLDLNAARAPYQYSTNPYHHHPPPQDAAGLTPPSYAPGITGLQYHGTGYIDPLAPSTTWASFM
uniref:Uncharacterized protein n=1 Tax=Plectus sambesii TaxID=2011161 RepID=A0A914WJV4_9BILA